jgi:hypothetical protein
MSEFDDFGTALDETPDNINFLSPLVFKFAVKKTPTLNFYVQNVNLPGMHLQQADIPNPLVSVPTPGDHILYDDLMINFKVNEDFTNWLEIHNWITGLGFPKNYGQHAALTAATVPLGEGLTSDVSLIVMNSSRIPTYNIVFRNAFPISISSLIFDSTRTRDDYIDAAATFRYDFYEFEVVD